MHKTTAENIDAMQQKIDKKTRNVLISELRLANGSLSVTASNFGFSEELLRHYLDYYKIFPDDYGPREE